jgi:hypothetical protein
VDERRKEALLIAAAILAARELARLEYKPCPATEAAIANAVTMAEKILRKIDNRFPAERD